MARKFDELRKKMSPKRRRESEVEAQRMLLDMELQELRQKLGAMNQADVAEVLEVTQGYISKLERQNDMLVSKLYTYVQALGGEVEIRAKFPDKEVRITQFEDLEKLKAV